VARRPSGTRTRSEARRDECPPSPGASGRVPILSRRARRSSQAGAPARRYLTPASVRTREQAVLFVWPGRRQEVEGVLHLASRKLCVLSVHLKRGPECRLRRAIRRRPGPVHRQDGFRTTVRLGQGHVVVDEKSRVTQIVPVWPILAFWRARRTALRTPPLHPRSG
jgi:hypothetical protein